MKEGCKGERAAGSDTKLVSTWNVDSVLRYAVVIGSLDGRLKLRNNTQSSSGVFLGNPEIRGKERQY